MALQMEDVEMDRSAAYQTARRKSLYGHRSWLVWKTLSGEWRAAREDRDSLREAIKAQGEHGEQFYAFSNGTAFVQTPKLAALRLANMGYC